MLTKNILIGMNTISIFFLIRLQSEHNVRKKRVERINKSMVLRCSNSDIALIQSIRHDYASIDFVDYEDNDY